MQLTSRLDVDFFSAMKGSDQVSIVFLHIESGALMLDWGLQAFTYCVLKEDVRLFTWATANSTMKRKPLSVNIENFQFSISSHFAQPNPLVSYFRKQLKYPNALKFFLKSRKVWKSAFWTAAVFKNRVKLCIFFPLVQLNTLTSTNDLLAHSNGIVGVFK